jgi:hypothetical protein
LAAACSSTGGDGGGPGGADGGDDSSGPGLDAGGDAGAQPCATSDTCNAPPACTPGSFTTESVPLVSNDIDEFDFVLDTAGAVHVVYEVYTPAPAAGIHYARRDAAGTWATSNTPSIEVASTSALHPSLAIDASGTLHACYVSNPTGPTTVVRYAYLPAGASAWTTTTADPTSATGAPDTAIALDALGGVACAAWTGGYAKVAYLPPGGAFTAGAFFFPANAASLAFDSASKLHALVTTDETPSKVLFFDVPLPLPDGGVAAPPPIETDDAGAGQGDEGLPSLTVVDDAGVRGGFARGKVMGTPGVVFVERTGGAWTTTTIDVGHAPSFAGDAPGRSHVAYARTGGASAGLYYAFAPPGGAWSSPALVDAAGAIAVKLRTTSPGAAWLVYRQGSGFNYQLHLAFDTCK